MLSTPTVPGRFSVNAGFVSDSQNTAKILLDAYKNVASETNKNFAIVVKKNSTAGVFLIKNHEAYMSAERIPTVRSATDQPTLPWVDRIVECALSDQEALALREISLVTTRLKSVNGGQQMSAGLSQLSKFDLPDVLLTALLRNTYSFKANISTWHAFLNLTERRLIAKGREPQKILRGLIKKN